VSPVEWYTLVVVHLTLIPVNAFPLFYRRTQWRSTDIGQALMLKACALAALFDVGVAGFWLPFVGYAYVYAAVVTVVGIAITRQYWVMRRHQHASRNMPTPDGEF